MNYPLDNALRRRLRTVESVSGVKAKVDGRPCTLFCTNDYLGLAAHPAVISAAKETTGEFGFGAGSAPLIAGNTLHHARLAEKAAELKQSKAALVFGSGYLANAGIIPALAGERDVILSDRLNHASIIDGCRLSRADTRIYEHLDMDSLGRALRACAGYRRRLIVTEGVFSMDGDIAPLPEIMLLADRYEAAVVVDEAHSTGVLGGTGRGTFEHFGQSPCHAVQMGTLGKALGSYGAFAAAQRCTIDLFVNSARSFMFSTALPPAACAAASAAIDVIKKEPGLRHRLTENASRLRRALLDLGFRVGGDGTPIIPVMMGDADEALRASERLLDAGFLAPAIRPPTVPHGESRVRFTVSALHSQEDIDSLLEAMKGL